MEQDASLAQEDTATVFYIGHHESSETTAIPDARLREFEDLGYDFVTTPITTPHFRQRVARLVSEHAEQEDRNVAFPLISPLAPEDTLLTPEVTNPSRIAFASHWIDLGSHDPAIAHISRSVLNLEVAYAAFCGINNVVLYGPLEGSDVVQYARAIREALAVGPYMQVHILLSMAGDLEMDYPDGAHLSGLASLPEGDVLNGSADDFHMFDTWKAWHSIRSLCEYSQKLSIALELPRQLPAAEIQSRWHSEPIRILTYPRTSFLRNAKGYPVLSKGQQQLLTKFARLRFPPWMLLVDVGQGSPTASAALSDSTSLPTPAEASQQPKEKSTGPVPHLRYLRHLQNTQPPRPPIERFGQGYQDWLQSPLQPLTDNLESVTYEVFEKDPIKYAWYQRAIAAALKDLRAKVDQSRPLIVAVVGAGRGPLVARVLQASIEENIEVMCWAVEKNPNAYVLLQHRNKTDPLWRDQVNLVKSDMRHWPGPQSHDILEHVDILVSELLGSFADNELSPECLDGVQRVLHPEHGVSIPTRYSAHLTPIATPRIHSDLLSKIGNDKWDIPYVVMLHQQHFLSAAEASVDARIPDVREAWSFNHPVPPRVLEQSRLRAGGGVGSSGWVGGDGSNEHNSRQCRLNFNAQGPGVCHGIAGYFETVLYSGPGGTVELSTNPVTMEEKSKDMISWFPIFFPIKTPLYVPEFSEIIVYMWRQTDDRGVWYEWLLEVWRVQEDMGRSMVAVSDLGSSRKNACLM